MRDLRNDTISIQVKLAALWASLMSCYIYADYFQLYVPKVTAGLVSGDNLLNSPAKLFATGILLAIHDFFVGVAHPRAEQGVESYFWRDLLAINVIDRRNFT